MGEVGCYTLDLYCDGEHTDGLAKYEGGFGQFTGGTLARARRDAKRAGWSFAFRRRPGGAPKVGGHPCVYCPRCTAIRRRSEGK